MVRAIEVGLASHAMYVVLITVVLAWGGWLRICGGSLRWGGGVLEWDGMGWDEFWRWGGGVKLFTF